MTSQRKLTSCRRWVIAVLIMLLAVVIPAVSGAASRPKEHVPPTLVSPKNNAHIRAGTHINFTVRSFPGDQYLWVHVSRSPKKNFREPVHHRLCGVIKDDVGIYDFKPTSKPTVYKTRTYMFHYKGFWMVTPGTYYWQAFRINYFHADGCIEAPVQKLVITR